MLSNLALARPDISDGPAIVALARSTPLDENSPYAYLLMCRDFADTCTVARDREGIIGFTLGYMRPRDPETLFVWQIATVERARGQGVGRAMLDELLLRTGAMSLEATVNPSNSASLRLFRATARAHRLGCDETVLFDAEHFPSGSGDEIEVLLRLAPPPDDG